MIYIYDTYVYDIYICIYMGEEMYLLTVVFVKTVNCLEGNKIQSCIGAGPKTERSEPLERSEACSERSDEARDSKLHITQTKGCAYHRLKTAHQTN